MYIRHHVMCGQCVYTTSCVGSVYVHSVSCVESVYMYIVSCVGEYDHIYTLHHVISCEYAKHMSTVGPFPIMVQNGQYLPMHNSARVIAQFET